MIISEDTATNIASNKKKREREKQILKIREQDKDPITPIEHLLDFLTSAVRQQRTKLGESDQS